MSESQGAQSSQAALSALATTSNTASSTGASSTTKSDATHVARVCVLRCAELDLSGRIRDNFPRIFLIFQRRADRERECGDERIDRRQRNNVVGQQRLNDGVRRRGRAIQRQRRVGHVSGVFFGQTAICCAHRRTPSGVGVGDVCRVGLCHGVSVFAFGQIAPVTSCESCCRRPRPRLAPRRRAVPSTATPLSPMPRWIWLSCFRRLRMVSSRSSESFAPTSARCALDCATRPLVRVRRWVRHRAPVWVLVVPVLLQLLLRPPRWRARSWRSRLRRNRVQPLRRSRRRCARRATRRRWRALPISSWTTRTRSAM
jgi:hypothetical protein